MQVEYHVSDVQTLINSTMEAKPVRTQLPIKDNDAPAAPNNSQATFPN